MALGYREALSNIERGKVSPVYLIYGEEEYLQEKLIQKIREVWLTDVLPEFNESKEDGSQLTGAQIADMANQLPFMAPRRLIVVDKPACLPFAASKTKNKKDEQTSQQDEKVEKEYEDGEDNTEGRKSDQALLDYLANPAATTCLIFWCHEKNPDKRGKLIKIIDKLGGLVETSHLKTPEIIDELRHLAAKAGKSFGPGALDYLVHVGQSDLRSLTNELEKCLIYAGDAPTIDLDMVKEIVTPSLEADIFYMIDSMAKKQITPAIRQLRGLLVRGEPGVRILYMITKQFRYIFRAKVYLKKGCGKQQIVKALGCHQYVAEKAMQQSRNFTFPELEKIMAMLLAKDFALKDGTSPRQALESLIIELGMLKG